MLIPRTTSFTHIHSLIWMYPCCFRLKREQHIIFYSLVSVFLSSVISTLQTDKICDTSTDSATFINHHISAKRSLFIYLSLYCYDLAPITTENHSIMHPVYRFPVTQGESSLCRTNEFEILCIGCNSHRHGCDVIDLFQKITSQEMSICGTAIASEWGTRIKVDI